MPWVAYLVIREEQDVGFGSFKGQPVDGKFEIAYCTLKPFEGQAISSFVCREIICISHKAVPEILIAVTTAPEENASVKILKTMALFLKWLFKTKKLGIPGMDPKLNSFLK